MRTLLKRSVQKTLSAGALRYGAAGPAGTFGLTFDDGPSADVTPQLLQLLDRHKAKATFYLIGEKAAEQPTLTQEIVAAGHRLGNHSYSHKRFSRISAAEQRDEIARAEGVLKLADGAGEHAFRPPWGDAPPSLLLRAARSRLALQLWTIDSKDYTLSADAVVEHLAGVKPRSSDVILFHDDADRSVKALAELLPRWADEGVVARAI